MAKYYFIRETLENTTLSKILNSDEQYVAIMNMDEFLEQKDSFGFGIDMVSYIEDNEIFVTKAEVNFDSITGSFSIPNRDNIMGEYKDFLYVLDEKGIVFIDNNDVTKEFLYRIMNSKKWRIPSLERFIFDFLESITYRDLPKLEKYEKEMDEIEDRILSGSLDNVMERIVEIRGELQDIRIHYEQLLDLSQELTENENNFFKSENLRYFRLYSDRILRLKDIVISLREQTMQLRDLYHYELDLKSNHLVTILTLVATIFMPLTLIAGWYGMNFANMPELSSKWGYPAVIIVCILVAAGEIIFFKKKKWL